MTGPISVTSDTPADASAGWTTTPSPNTGTNDSLSDVSCVSASSCKAVGVRLTAQSVSRTLIESWNGATWSITPSPNRGTKNNELLAGSCVSASSCKAVGDHTDTEESPTRTLLESWNGTAWSISSSPVTGSEFNILIGVSCVSASSCKAVGYLTNANHVARTLTESWNGITWSIIPSPNVGTSDNILQGVSCVSTSSCKAVGYYANSSVNQTLIESWNGTKWSIISSPDNGTNDNVLNGISCGSGSSCKAVGFYANTSGTDQTLIEHWNGTTWSLASSPDVGTSDNFLIRVSCVSASSCQGVGYCLNAMGIYRTLIESWNGATWSITRSPNTGTNWNQLQGASCVSPTSCQAVGGYLTSSNVSQTLIESYG